MTTIFLSHTSSDKPFVRRVAAYLRQLDAAVWLDEQEIKPGESLLQKISTGLNSSGIVLVFMSSASVASNWVQKELMISMTQEINSGVLRVIPLKIEDCTLPNFLTDKLYIDFTKNYRTGITQLCKGIFPDKKIQSIDIVTLDRDGESIFNGLFHFPDEISVEHVERIEIHRESQQLCLDLHVPVEFLGFYDSGVFGSYSIQPDADFPDQIAGVGFTGEIAWVEVYFALPKKLSGVRSDIEQVVSLHNQEIGRCKTFFDA